MSATAPMPTTPEGKDVNSLVPDLRTVSDPSDLDRRIYYAFRAGNSVKELAQSQQLSEEEISQSIFRVRLENERYSSLATSVESRKLYLSQIPDIAAAINRGLKAKKLVGKKVVMIDKDSGEQVVMEEQVEREDHATQLQAVDATRYLLAVVQPKDPAVQITTNSQTNILNQASQPAQLGSGLTSPEAVIRSIVAARQNALPASATVSQPAVLEGEMIAREDDSEEEPDETDEDAEDDADDPLEEDE